MVTIPDIVAVSALRVRCKRLISTSGAQPADGGLILWIGEDLIIHWIRGERMAVMVILPDSTGWQVALDDVSSAYCRYDRRLIDDVVMPKLVKHMVLDDLANS